MNNKDLLEKVIDTTALASGGQLLGDQAQKFLDLTVDVSKMLKMVRTMSKTIPHGEIDTINVGSPVTEKATENADTGNIYDPSFGKIEYTCVKVRSAFNLTTEAYQDNIERKGLRQRTMTSFAKRISTDLEYLAIQGNTTLYTGSDVISRLLKTDNGWHQQTSTGCNYVDAAGAGISLALFNAMIKAMPARFKMSRAGLIFFVSPSAYQDYWDSLAGRLTGLGDYKIDGTPNQAIRAYGIPVVEIPLIPENLTISSPYSIDGTFIWLTFPENFIWITLRMMDVYWEFQPRTDRWENTTYCQVDQIIEQKAAIVKANNVSISGTAYT